ncbi:MULTISPECIES: carbon storage regulator CsrA [Paenibacillus]|uniref:carbon storage regulator CsrA n=1 Tax=Paenibacillus TaxID=44249 RepID=UPI0004907EFA|nr:MULTISPECIES: carbon storage regulator CsrA [Paenibacillus]
MLILSRNKGQKIIINQDIAISVIDILGDQVKIGIEAPDQVTIYREEIYELIQKQNKEAAVESIGNQTELLKRMVPPTKK